MVFYVDGSSLGNPGEGGWGVIMADKENGNVLGTLSKYYPHTTNNRMELEAILTTMSVYGEQLPNSPPTVYSDSAYAINTYTKWMFWWAENDWTKSDGKTPENLDIIKQYYDLYQQGYRINLVKIKGHSGNRLHDLADKLAKGVDIN